MKQPSKSHNLTTTYAANAIGLSASDMDYQVAMAQLKKSLEESALRKAIETLANNADDSKGVFKITYEDDSLIHEQRAIPAQKISVRYNRSLEDMHEEDTEVSTFGINTPQKVKELEIILTGIKGHQLTHKDQIMSGANGSHNGHYYAEHTRKEAGLLKGLKEFIKRNCDDQAINFEIILDKFLQKSETHDSIDEALKDMDHDSLYVRRTKTSSTSLRAPKSGEDPSIF